MPQYYNRCKVYVLCSLYEGNPKTLLEAMACGCAVVGTNVLGIQEIIRHQENGLLVPEQPEVCLQLPTCCETVDDTVPTNPFVMNLSDIKSPGQLRFHFLTVTLSHKPRVGPHDEIR